MCTFSDLASVFFFQICYFILSYLKNQDIEKSLTWGSVHCSFCITHCRCNIIIRLQVGTWDHCMIDSFLSPDLSVYSLCFIHALPSFEWNYHYYIRITYKHITDVVNVYYCTLFFSFFAV